MPAKLQYKTSQVSCRSEYDRLLKVIVCSPRYMKIDKVINNVQAHYKTNNIDQAKAIEQHNSFVNVLQKNGVEVIELEPNPGLNEQVFTRDIGFCVRDQFLIAHMANEIRKKETNVLTDHLEKQTIPYQSPFSHYIEGGDVLLDEGKIWVGISQRTALESSNWLGKRFPSYQVISLPIRSDILHLDCAFNILSPDTAIVFPEAFSRSAYQTIKSHYSVIEVSSTEQFFMGTNVLSIGNKKVISLPQNKQVNKEMRNRGFDVLEVDFSEIIKSGGSFRCCSLPIYRA